jgi:hypothetical protein
MKKHGETLKKGLIYVLADIGLGSFVTAGLVFFPQVEHRIGATITRWGYPYSLYEKCVKIVPGFPTSESFLPQNLILDIAIWSLIIGIPLFSYKLVKRYKSK